MKHCFQYNQSPDCTHCRRVGNHVCAAESTPSEFSGSRLHTQQFLGPSQLRRKAKECSKVCPKFYGVRATSSKFVFQANLELGTSTTPTMREKRAA